jgi:hypothetical protein
VVAWRPGRKAQLFLTAGKVAPLEHKAINHTVERGPFVVQRLLCCNANACPNPGTRQSHWRAPAPGSGAKNQPRRCGDGPLLPTQRQRKFSTARGAYSGYSSKMMRPAARCSATAHGRGCACGCVGGLLWAVILAPSSPSSPPPQRLTVLAGDCNIKIAPHAFACHAGAPPLAGLAPPHHTTHTHTHTRTRRSAGFLTLSRVFAVAHTCQ